MTPEQNRERRKARFLGDLKGELRQAANQKGLSLSDIGRSLGCHRSVVSRALDAATNVEAFTLFDLAEVVGMEWTVSLRPRDHDLGEIVDTGLRSQHNFKISQAPVVSVKRGKMSINGNAATHMARSGTLYIKDFA